MNWNWNRALHIVGVAVSVGVPLLNYVAPIVPGPVGVGIGIAAALLTSLGKAFGKSTAVAP